MERNLAELPVVVVGAGPIGLAAAAHLAARDQPFILLEAGDQIADSVNQWRHVRMFTPWPYNIDPEAARLLATAGWSPPSGEDAPTGAALIDRYLRPLAELPALSSSVRLGARVASIWRAGGDKLSAVERTRKPFAVRLEGGEEIRGRAVIDASGTWRQPNPMGAGGVPAIGELEARDRITYGIPDVLGAEQGRYADRRVLVVGGGHSAIQNVLSLAELQKRVPTTEAIWATRRPLDDSPAINGAPDILPARAALWRYARAALESGEVTMLTPFQADRVKAVGDTLRVSGSLMGEDLTVEVDEAIVSTGFRPDLRMTRELQIAYNPYFESSVGLAPLIDPGRHSCQTVPVHGVEELRHPEPGFFTVGAKSYGRVPNFLLATGYAQVRAVVDELADDPAGGRAAPSPAGDACSPGGCCGAEPVPPVVRGPAAHTEADAGCGHRDCCGAGAASDVFRLDRADSRTGRI